jgi:hypothetical protein
MATLNHVFMKVAVPMGCAQGGIKVMLMTFAGSGEIPEHGVGGHAEGLPHCRDMVQ